MIQSPTLSSVSLEQVLALFSAYLFDHDYSPRTTARYAGVLSSFYSWLHFQLGLGATADLPLPLPRDLSSYRAYMLERGSSPATINQSLSALKTYANWQVETGQIEHNWAQAAKLLSIQYAPKQGLTKQEYHKLMRQIDTLQTPSRTKAVFALLLGCGLRREEAISVRVRDVTFKTAAGTGRQSGMVWVRAGKGLGAREVPFGGWVYLALKEQSKDKEAGELLLGLKAAGVRDVVERWGKKAEIEGLHPHRLRRAYGQMQRANRPIETVKRLLGHKRLDTTAIYTETPSGDFEDTPKE